MGAGKTYKFPPVYFIGVTRFPLHKDDQRYLYRYTLTDEIHYLSLAIPKCKEGADLPLIEKFGYTEELLELLFDSANITNFTSAEKIK